MTDDMITQLGGAPSSKKPYTNESANQEKGCRWESQQRSSSGIVPIFGFDIGAVADPPSAYLTSPQFTAAEAMVAGRAAVNFTANTAENLCNLAVQNGSGSAIVAVLPSFPEMTRDQSCQQAQAIAAAVATTLP